MATTSAPTALLNFNGGTLSATGTNAGASFLTDANIDAVTVYSGGGTIDNNGTSITVGKALLTNSGTGITNIAVTNGGSGYIGAPLVTISGGAGSTATAYANMVDDGTGNGTFKIDTITVTSNGVYTSAPTTVTLTGGGASTAATIGTITTGANVTTGGMTFQGAGTTTLSGANTYTGATNINAGNLIVSGSLAGAVNVNSGGTLGAGSGTINGVTTVASGGILWPGVSGSGTHILTLNNNVAFNSGSTLKINLDNTGNVSDKLVITGSLSLAGVGADTLTFNLLNTPPAGNQFTIATWTGTGPDGVTNSFTVSNMPAGYSLQYNLNSLVVVPEPGTWVMLIGGVGMLVLFRRRRRA